MLLPYHLASHFNLEIASFLNVLLMSFVLKKKLPNFRRYVTEALCDSSRCPHIDVHQVPTIHYGLKEDEQRRQYRDASLLTGSKINANSGHGCQPLD